MACANHWTKGMEEISSKVLKNPSIFISSCMEAAIYGGMKLDVRRGTPEEMDRDLLEIVQSKRFSRTIIFCRGSAEVFKVEQMLSEVLYIKLCFNNLFERQENIMFRISDWRDTHLSSQSIYRVRFRFYNRKVEPCSAWFCYSNLHRRCFRAIEHKKCTNSNSLLYTTPFQVRF